MDSHPRYYIRKWNQGRNSVVESTKTRRNNKNERVITPDTRVFIPLDFFIYFIQYLFPPSALFIDRFANYPLQFSIYNFRITEDIKKKYDDPKKEQKKQPAWMIANCIFLFVSTVVLLFPTGSSISLLERLGPLFGYIIRAFITSYMEAFNYDVNPHKDLKLDTYPIVPVNKRGEFSADDLFQDIKRQSNYKRISFWDPKHIHMSLACVILTIGLLLIGPVMRIIHHSVSTPLGNTISDAIVVIIGMITVFFIVCTLLHSFFQAFALYKSMTAGMGRLKRAIVGLDFKNERFFMDDDDFKTDKENNVIESEEENEETDNAEEENEESDDDEEIEDRVEYFKNKLKKIKKVLDSEIDKQKKQFSTDKNKQDILRIDVTDPVNLRAFLVVKDAIHARGKGPESMIIKIGAAFAFLNVLCFFLFLLIHTWIKTEGNLDHFDAPNLEDIQESFIMKDSIMMTYIAFVFGISLVVLSWIGSVYNKSSRNAFTRKLYDIWLCTNLEVACETNLNRYKIDDLNNFKASLKLIPEIIKHLNQSTPELGVLGWSYSQIFNILLGLFSTYLTNMIFKNLWR
eukprot:TRINITY_DN12355_c0_g1_i1.p1 TRINITY_DN12355_c0_g1~~TRINITY_DN12355_c0_g1_i1.p1  ORF type:complete len:571 (-),score=150.60 TRINITY_DN12355_c0_g1_i1:62-1774(-)